MAVSLTGTTTSVGLEPPKILIVDDQPANLDVLEAMLGSIDGSLIRATSADEALLCVLQHDFAALILDIKMPDMSGVELATLIKQRRRSRDVPILFLTAHTVDEEALLQGYGVGAVDYLSKPVNPDILRSKVGIFVELFRKTRALGVVNDALHREVVERQEAQEALRLANEDLERRVAERTAALLLANERERSAREEAERQSRLKDEFLATLSHELRTPLNAVLGWLAILRSGKPIGDLQSALDVITRNAEIQGRLIEDMLDMNRLMSGHVRLDRAPTRVGDLVQATIDALTPAADAKGVRLALHVDGDTREVLADSRRLQQVLWNLVQNGIKFAGGTPQDYVNVRLTQGPDVLEVVVCDNGRGIEPAFLPHVFERFRQQDASSTRAVFGLGLGLSIAKHLVELHGGTLQANSDGPGRGARFELRLPCVPVTPDSCR
ncbi:MAG TPA: ATP-binding protein [Vicinamibacterales bacterium]|jgi:signal transduction histidine kinase